MLSFAKGRVFNEDIIDTILDGIDQYKTLLDVIHARDTLISFNELHDKLINHELSLAQQNQVTELHQPSARFRPSFLAAKEPKRVFCPLQ